MTTVRQPAEEMGSRMARELLALLRAPRPSGRRVVLDADLVVRESA